MSVLESLKTFFTRDLTRLRQEIALYIQEENLWKTDGQIANSAGNLCLHLIGNLNTYIGRELGQTGYIRHRELEFSQKDVPQQELLQKLDQTLAVVQTTLAHLEESALEKEYPVLVFEDKMPTGYFLIHLATHLSYHLGQINYHRRLLDQ
ncbi:MAG: DinB family protein [Rufibacter sp.]